MVESFNVKRLGEGVFPSPLKLSKTHGADVYDYVTDADRVLLDPTLEGFRRHVQEGTEPLSFEKAGPRELNFFDPPKVRVGIVTCGGLCPGLNVVIRSLVMELWHRYGVREIKGYRYGYEGLVKRFGHEPMRLVPELVETIYTQGGSILGSSRGNQDVTEIVDTLAADGINILFTVGGDGTLKGAHAIHEEITKRRLPISITAIPKTIDNDICYIERTFGFETAVTQSFDIIKNAHNEAKGAYDGIALIKLMGRDSGFIAAHAALAVEEANFVLVPELDFDLGGPNGFLAHLTRRMQAKHHALIVVAEGAGQKFFDGAEARRDKSGNLLHDDIGLYLKDRILADLRGRGMDVSLKYIDPSYIIRSAAAIAGDSEFCNLLAHNAVHAAMSGRTDFVVGYWNQNFTLLPIPAAVSQRKKIGLESELWFSVLEATGQPISMKNE